VCVAGAEDSRDYAGCDAAVRQGTGICLFPACLVSVAVVMVVMVVMVVGAYGFQFGWGAAAVGSFAAGGFELDGGVGDLEAVA